MGLGYVTHRDATPPLCVCCGKPIPKWTETVWVRREDDGYTASTGTTVYGVLRSKAECQARTNHKVVSVSYWGEGEKRHISHFGTWDGESYRDQWFCSGPCVDRFAYIMARAGRCTNLY